MRRVVLCALTTAAAAASAALAADPPRPVIVTRDSMDLPAGCAPRQVAGLLLRFESAFNGGDRAALERLFASAGAGPPNFQWFTTDEIRVLRRRELVPQLLALRARGERMRFLEADVGRFSPRDVGVGLSLLRFADGTTLSLHGKAGIDCARGRLYVWSTGVAPFRFCPDPIGIDRATVALACSRLGARPQAQEVADDFSVSTASTALPPRCRPGPVSAHVVHLLRAFNVGASAAFARDFAAFATVQPYTDSFTQLVGRAALRRFAAARHARGDGWTAAAVLPPNVPGVKSAIYRVDLRVTSAGAPFGSGGVKVVVDCRTGLIARWVGPAMAAP